MPVAKGFDVHHSHAVALLRRQGNAHRPFTVETAMKWSRTTIAAAVLAGVAGQVLAADLHTFSSTARITKLTYELIDLRPDDGIAPDAHFLDPGGSSTVEVWRRGKSTRSSNGTDQMFGGSLASVLTPSGSGVAATTWNQGTGLNVLAQGTGSLLGDARTGHLTVFESQAYARGYGLNVVLSPGTEMRWTGSYELEAFADRYYGGRGNHVAGSQLQIFFGDYDDSTPTFLTYSAAAYANPRLGLQHDREGGSFTFSQVNSGGSWASYKGGVVATATGGWYLNPIPEPSTYALFAAGIGVVGVAARRRRPSAE